MRGSMLAEVDMERLMLSFNKIFEQNDLSESEQGMQSTLEVKNEYQESIQSRQKATRCE